MKTGFYTLNASTRIYLLLFSLYWAQGLPVGFMTQALPVILRAEGLSLSQIGGFGLLMLPWSIKIFWAPLVDRYGVARIGHYRSWILTTQLLSVLLLIALSFMPITALNEPQYLLLFFVGLLLMNTTGATQDIATDGLAVNILKSSQIAWGNTLQVMGSRLGFIVGGGAILWALDWLQWQATFLCLAALVFLNTLAIAFYQEPQHQKQSQTENGHFIQRIKTYLSHFLQSPEGLAWLWVLLTFKVADGLSGPITKPLLVDLGLSYSQIGIYITMFGAAAALLGAVVAGYSLQHLDRAQALFSFSILKIIALMGFTALAWGYEQGHAFAPIWVYLINAFEDLTSAMLLVVMLSLIMEYSRKAVAGTDFTLQVALLATVSGGLYMISGILGDILGYTRYLSLICVIAVCCLLPIRYWYKIKKP